MDVAAALAEFETDERRVVAARDVGSHARNVAGPDSDRDVGLVFRQPPAEYATLDGYEAAVERTAAGVDLRGWNVKRFAELLAGSNPAAFELLHSPVSYRESAALADLADAVGDRFNPMALYHHYRSLARSNYADGVEPGTDATVKRNLFVLRGALSAEYVRRTHAFPPVDLPAFLDAAAERTELELDDDLLARARELVERKRAGEGDEPVGDRCGDAVARLPAELDPAAHARSVPREPIDAFVRAAFRADGRGG